MPRRSKSPELVDAAETVRHADVLMFLAVYREVVNSPESDRANLSTLLERRKDRLGAPSTVLGQLKRVTRYLFGSGPDADELGRLFTRVGGLLQATPEGQTVYHRFVILRDIYDRLKADVAWGLGADMRTVRIGTPQTIGLRLLSSIFSDWKRLFGQVVRLEVETGNSRELIPRLNAGLLDVVVAYGGPGPVDAEITSAGLNVAFRPLGYESRMVLLAHPKAELFVREVRDARGRIKVPGEDLNRFYWEDQFRGEGAKPGYMKLRSVSLDRLDLDRSNSKLIIVPSWGQPPVVTALASVLPPARVTEVSWYDDALALVRMGQGVAVAAEIFSKRKRITAFRLTPESDFRRPIGIYYNRREGLTSEACRVVTFIHEYFGRFHEQIRAGTPPAIDDPLGEFTAFCDSFASRMERDWLTVTRLDYPKTG